ncbi:GAF and ANTAR domain-containing protein [Streptomyces sp. NPDC102365]|uniref:GAF and ANTAR domain-containing protein n=1 Tax=Streptomyces sp. NPDC102365 TaxID=3366162 RepID=UPI003804EB4F
MSWSEPDSGDAEQEIQILRTRITRELVGAVRDVPPALVPRALCRVCASLLPDVAGLSLSVLGQETGMNVVLFATDEVAGHLAEIQYTLGDGPGVEAVRLRAPVFAPDVTLGADVRRWPLFCVQAAKAGAAAVFSMPLTAGARALGTLDLYQKTTGPLDGGQVRTALLVADALSLAVTAIERAASGSGGVVTWLDGAESDRVEIHQATGVLMVHLGVGAEEALLRLRARAFAQGSTSLDVARAVIDGSTDFRDE